MVILQYDGTYFTFEDGHRIKVKLHQSNAGDDSERFLLFEDGGKTRPTPTMFMELTTDEAFKLALALLNDVSRSKFGGEPT